MLLFVKTTLNGTSYIGTLQNYTFTICSKLGLTFFKQTFSQRIWEELSALRPKIYGVTEVSHRLNVIIKNRNTYEYFILIISSSLFNLSQCLNKANNFLQPFYPFHPFHVRILWKGSQERDRNISRNKF